MGIDKFSEVTTKSWFSRITEALGGIIIGLILFVLSFVLLFWNEGRALKDAKTLQEGKRIVKEIINSPIDPNNNFKLVYLFGKADTNETLSDLEFGIKEKALKLNRDVEMYQWTQIKETSTKKNMGGSETTTTTYKYKKNWDDSVIDSSDFKEAKEHTNPKAMLYCSRDYAAEEIKVGDFFLSSGLKAQINNSTPLNIDNNMLLPENLKDKVKIHEGYFYLGNDFQNPEIGDLKIKFSLVKPQDVTIVAQQVNNKLGPYLAKAGGSIEMLRYGTYSVSDMFLMQANDIKILTWLLRLGGFILMFIGLLLFLRPLSVLSDFIPFLGSLVGVGTGVISFLVALIFSIITIALAWLAYRPFFAIALILLVVGLVIFIRKKIKEKKLKV